MDTKAGTQFAFNNEVADFIDSWAKEPIMTDKHIEMLMELEPKCRQTNIYKHSGRTLEESPDFMQEMQSAQLVDHMLQKIIQAPTGLHILGTPVLMIPVICERIRKELGK